MRLRDGSRVRVRAIRPDDRQPLAEAFQRLSPESRYRRFFTPMNQLSEGTLTYLTDVDHHDHEALVAFSEDGGLVGVARYVRIDPDSPVAEAAITVSDDWQGRGLARGLLHRLAARAREAGVAQFSALVKVENPAAARVLRELGPSELSRLGDEYRLLIDLPERGVGTKLTRALRAAAAGTLSLADTVARAAVRR
ncbi:MAG TPA: GNAT family N-acetyltransferase [Solirubrobacteraceae bacterium]|jgi:RimJ/RimL family protein N-acetyltransferase|nr:GNAT family N-acetyltransferase [Solirubrobacteraceae bacterium]